MSELQLVTVLYSCICHPLTEAKSVAPVASPQSPSPFPFLPIPYPFRRLLRSLTTRRQEARQKKTVGLISKATTLHVHQTFLYISLPFLHVYDVKMPSKYFFFLF